MNSFISRISGKAKFVAVAAVVAAAAVVVPMAVKAGFGPDRPTKVYSQGVKGFDHVTFNSFTNVPTIGGDERKFFNGKYPGTNTYSDPMLEAKDGDVLTLEVYVHNNADESLNTAPGQPGIAKNTTVRVDLPKTIAKKQQATAYISADNAAPKTVFDTLDVSAANGGMFEIEYVAGSAKITGNHINGSVPDSIVTTGAKIGSDSMNGDYKGCFDSVTYVTIQVKVKAPRYSLEKEVRPAGSKVWGETLNVKSGDTVEWISTFQNTGSSKLTSVNFIDQVPAGMTVVPGSVKLINGNFPNGHIYGPGAIQDNGRTINVDLGDYNPGPAGVAYVRYDTKIDPIKAEDCTTKTLVNKAFTTPEGFGAIWDDANVVVAGNTCNPKTPVYSCDLLTVTGGANRLVTINDFKFTAAGGATFKHAVINWGDSSTPLTTNTVAGQKHTYAADGTYIVKTTAYFTVNGKEVSADGANCVKTVTYKSGTPVEPPTTLVNTGAGDVLGIFAAVTVAGAFAHRFVLARRS